MIPTCSCSLINPFVDFGLEPADARAVAIERDALGELAVTLPVEKGLSGHGNLIDDLIKVDQTLAGLIALGWFHVRRPCTR